MLVAGPVLLHAAAAIGLRLRALRSRPGPAGGTSLPEAAAFQPANRRQAARRAATQRSPRALQRTRNVISATFAVEKCPESAPIEVSCSNSAANEHERSGRPQKPQ